MRDLNASEEQDASQLHLLEERQRLSTSALWRWQRQFFEEQAIDAWRHSIVPHYLTSNTFIAQAYAKVVFGYLRDLVRHPHQPLKQQQTVHILELGAGCGRFSYHFLKKFLPMLAQSPLSEVRIRYVMSDFSRGNLAFWLQHPFLQPYIEQGVLDFALADLSQPQDVVLQHSGIVLSGDPLVVLANYVFDSVEQDAFYVHDGVLYESLISLHSPQAEADPPDPAILQRLQASFHNAPASADYYPEKELNRILAAYRDTLVDSHVLMPAQAMRYLAHLKRISGNRMLLLSGDKGVAREEELLFNQPPHLASHGSISLAVNYHALAQFAELHGGCAMHMPRLHNGLHICALAFEPQPLTHDSKLLLETRLAFNQHICQLSPGDFYLLKRFIQPNAAHLKLPQILAYLRMSGWDSANFHGCYPAIMNNTEALENPLRHELAMMAKQVWDTYYPLGEQADLGHTLGNLMYELDYFEEAITYLQHSRALYGDAAHTLYNIGMCHYNLQRQPQALEYVRHALRLDPAYEPARVMLIELRAEMRQLA